MAYIPLGGLWTDPVSCVLYELPIDKAPPYKALSYAWDNGGTSNCFDIRCNGIIIAVSRNLFAALRRLRHSTEPVQVWVDALCINQKDDGERTHQVQLMREIYQKSEEVVIWLGEKARQDDVGKDALGAPQPGDPPSFIDWAGDSRDQNYWYAFLARQDKINPGVRDIFGAFCVLWLLSIGVETLEIKHLRHIAQSVTILNGLGAIMEQSWWQRTWVLQETVVTTKSRVYYDSISAPWEMLTQAADTYKNGLLTTSVESLYHYLVPLARFSGMIGTIETTRQVWRSPLRLVELLQILRQFRDRKATDPRDKVYALLGIIQYWGGPNRLFPDYANSVSQVYLKTSTTLIKNARSLDVLAGEHGILGGKFPKTSDRRPSWVTDWSFSPDINGQARLDTLYLYNAFNDDGDSAHSVRLHGRLLEISGLHVDDVLHVSPRQVRDNVNITDTFYRKMSHWRLVVKEWKSEFQNLSGGTYEYPGGGKVWDAFWRTVCADVEYNQDTNRGEHQRAGEGIVSASIEWLNGTGSRDHRRNTSIIAGYWQEIYTPKGDLGPEDAEAERKNAFHHAVERAAGGRTFFFTKEGYIGLGPRDMRSGDQVYVVPGSRVPFILRRLVLPITCRESTVETLISDKKETLIQIVSQPIETSRQQIREDSHEKACSRIHSSNCYLLVGDAYVHGIMDGEAVKASKRGLLETLYLW
ncbi:heterokaryon incompatibility protein-domain-containing protein [Podospora fimiseda]|uniref:Heterokaryon incompatibility protein-domain-containing protein n=1 Tax=Podospora fimiseda TaxID=252190 RepID=A0AAN7BW63_9PEZI|nr:heterokaryon incompatibility protein-domain-containing protein [Podospora fimiseda]